ncbi:MAG: hypothetical protein CVV13_03250 [Gammaproteobacteria bacterium HGW-Gammaproteobacteria-3]|nr:MAG: hypothetical protein CVV13_03250 [Gammaproteobacteria bacterium HGW-Gammaproteobacteria-3]
MNKKTGWVASYFARPHLRFSNVLFCPIAALRKQLHSSLVLSFRALLSNKLAYVIKAANMTARSIGLIFLVSGCSRDYTPEASATGEAIFQAACIECHQAEDKNAPDFFFTINAANANATYVAHKVHSGSLMMPMFPNIKGKHMRALSAYVLAHSFRK